MYPCLSFVPPKDMTSRGDNLLYFKDKNRGCNLGLSHDGRLVFSATDFTCF